MTSEIDDLTRRIIGCAMRVHTELGPGLLESAYEECLLFELHAEGLEARRQVSLPIVYKQVRIDVGYRIDLLVENRVVLELKSVAAIEPIHKAQVLSYLKLGGLPAGLLINFNVEHLRNGINRLFCRVLILDTHNSLAIWEVSGYRAI